MTRCPNCGSAIRIGAKFCTSCGFRLATEESAASPARSPFATTSNAPWSAPLETGQPVEPTAATREDEPVEPAWSKDDQDGEGEVVPSADVVTAELQSESDIDDNHRPGPSWYAPPQVDTSGPVSDDMIAALGSDESDQLGSDIAEYSGGDALVAPAATSWPETTGGSSMDDDTAETAEPITEAAAGWTDDPLAEARTLAARLAELLASLPEGGSAAGSPPSPVTVHSSIVDEGDVESLKTIVEAAQVRPKDIDVMLDLVLRADTIAAVLADRDHLLTALRGGSADTDNRPATDDEDPLPPSAGWSVT